jgi:hypothetical protein
MPIPLLTSSSILIFPVLDPSDKALKTGIVKNELRKQWNLEREAIKKASQSTDTREDLSEALKDVPIPHPNMVDEWALNETESPHPLATKYLRDHLLRPGTAESL